MQSIEVVLSMLLAVLASGYIARMLPFSLPLPIVQILLGALIAAVPSRGVHLDPGLFFLLFLPPLLFLDGWRIPKDDLLRDARVIVQLALGLVVFTVIGAGYLIHWMIPSMPLAVAFALAAIISPTDPVALSAITRRVPMPKRLMHVLEGESLLNDASSLVCFRFAIVAATTGSFSISSAATTFVWVAAAGLGVGFAFTWIVARGHLLITRRFGQESGTSVLASLLTPFGAYMLAEHLHASGILAAVAAGITMSQVELSGRAPAVARVQRHAIWDAIQFALNGIAFVLLGEQLPDILRGAVVSVAESGHRDPWWLLAYVVAINVGLIVLRFVWVWTSLHVHRLIVHGHRAEEPAPSLRLIAAASVSGVRGAITLAGVFALPFSLPDGSPFPARTLVIFLAAGVILVSLVSASLALPRLLAGLKAAPEPRDQRMEDEARDAAARAAVAAVERAQHELLDAKKDPEIYANAAVRVMSLYSNRISDDGANGIAAEELRKADHAHSVLRLAGLRAEREAIFDLARRRRISDEIARRLARELDLVESRYLAQEENQSTT